MTNPVDVLTAPSQVFARLKLMPRWSAPFLLVMIGYFIVNWHKRCGADFPSFELTSLIGPAISAPIVTLAVWSALSSFLYLVATIVI